MQTNIIVDDQLSGNAKTKENGRLYFNRGDAENRCAKTEVPYDGRLTISIRFNCLMNITGISVQGKGIEPTRKVEFTKRYSVNVSYGTEGNNFLGKVSRK